MRFHYTITDEDTLLVVLAEFSVRSVRDDLSIEDRLKYVIAVGNTDSLFTGKKLTWTAIGTAFIVVISAVLIFSKKRRARGE